MKKIILICIVVLLFSLISLIIVHTIVDNQKYNISGQITEVEVSTKTHGGTIKTTEKEHISVLLNCIKDVKKNNQHRIDNIQTAPLWYEITFHFDNGEVKTYEYTVYPATDYNYPFQSFYDLFDNDK